MANSEHERSGTQKAVDLARLAKSIARIIKAAAAAGPYGAAAEAVKEALPFLVKLAVGLLAVIVLLIFVVFTAIPNMFFGYDSSHATPVIGMTAQAKNIGGVYMSMENFESLQLDSIITGIVGQYEEQGITIDKIEVDTRFTTADLNWLVAISSVYYQQDLNIMNPEDLMELCVSFFTYTPLLSSEDENILKITIDPLDQTALMERLGFDEEEKTWAGAIEETIRESDALTKYGAYYAPALPDFSGDSSGPTDMEHGDNFSNDINISGFTSPHTKNNLDLAAYAIQAWENNWGYVWGTYGNVLTQSLFEYKLEQYPDGVGNYKEFIENNWLGRRTTDCVGLIKGYGWLDVDTLKIKYGTNGMPDYGANAMHTAAVDAGTEGVDYGDMSTMPEIPGLALWKDGHIGVYIGGGYAIEASSTKTGVVKTKVAGRGWSGWCKIPYITYLEGT